MRSLFKRKPSKGYQGNDEFHLKLSKLGTEAEDIVSSFTETNSNDFSKSLGYLISFTLRMEKYITLLKCYISDSYYIIGC